MSLKVWLPLTKDLRNQGLDNVTVTNNGATFNSTGKLGGCYYFNNAYAWLPMDYSTFGTEFSVAFWYKIDTAFSGNRHLVCLCNQYGWPQLKFTCAATSNSTLAFNIGDGSTSARSLSTSQIIGSWQHICFTFNNKIAKVYVNGVQTGTATYPINPDWSGTTKMGIGGAPDGHECAITLSLNDVRIYDHCLSPMEIKEISKGLILHYPLSDKYLESTTNIITSEDCLSATCYNGALGKYSYGSNTDMYKEVTYFEGRKGTKVYNKTNGTAMFPYIYISNMFTSNGTNAPEYKTLSFDYYTNKSTSIYPYKLGNGSGTATYIVTNTEIKTGTGTNSVTIPIKPNMWNHIEITFHGTTDANSEWGYIQNCPSHTSNTNNFWFFANMQLETKDHATGYAGVGGTRNSNIVYDCSGFCNNGTISGALTISNDTPKYKVSTYIPAAAIITHNRCLDNTNQEWSCAAWVKPTVAGNYQNLNNFNEANRLYHGTYPLLYANSGANDYYNYGNLALPTNQWSHIVFVFKNSDGTKLIYINGENHTNTNGPNKTSIPKGIPDTVIIGESYEGGLCDYREYATALSVEDIKSLYNNSAYIDNQGNIYGAVYEEV